MQNLFHCVNLALGTVLFTLFSPFLAHEATAFPAGQVNEKASELRLIAASKIQHDVYHIGLEITLKPGALTYWRQPGDAGVPPVFSFAGSENLANAEVLYPAPSRIKEDEGEAFGYQDKVVFPVHVQPRDKTRPVFLKLAIDYAVCERICIPVKSQAEITLPLLEGTPQDAAVTAAEALVPRPLSKTEVSQKVTLIPDPKNARPTWHLHWNDPTPVSDLFAEAPEGWYFETKTTNVQGEFSIIAVEARKADGTAPVPVTLTLTGPRQNFEFTLPLDAAGAAR